MLQRHTNELKKREPRSPSLKLTSTILVTGAAGNVGSEVVLMLRREGLPFRAAVRKVGGEKPIYYSKESVSFDFLDPSTFSTALAGVTSILRFVSAMRKRGLSDSFMGVMTVMYTINKIGRAAIVTGEVEATLKRKPILFEQFAADFRDAWIV